VYDNIHLMLEKIVEKEDMSTTMRKTFQNYNILGVSILDLADVTEFLKNDDTVNKFKENKSYLVTTLDQIATESSKEFQDALINLQKSFGFTNIVMIIITILVSVVIANTIAQPIYYLVDVMRSRKGGDY